MANNWIGGRPTAGGPYPPPAPEPITCSNPDGTEGQINPETGLMCVNTQWVFPPAGWKPPSYGDQPISCQSPQGIEGEIADIGGERHRCTGGQWVTQAEYIPGGETPPGALTCTNPDGAEGDIGPTGLICRNGNWEYQGYTPPPGPPDIPGPIPGDIPQEPPTSPWQVGTPQWWEETAGPQAGYLSSLGLWGLESMGPWQRYLSSQYAPLEMLRGLSGYSEALGMPGPSMGGGLMANWGSQYAQAPGSMYGLATQQLGNIFGMTPTERDVAGMRGGAGNFGDLLSMGLREFLGPASQWIGSRMPQLNQAWLSQYPQQMGPTFMDWVIQKYNLGRYFPGGFPASQGGQPFTQGGMLGAGPGGYPITPGI